MNLHAFVRSFSSPMTRKARKKATEIFDKNVKATLSLHSPYLLRIDEDCITILHQSQRSTMRCYGI